MFSYKYSKSFKDRFFIEQFQFWNFSIRREFYKEKVNKEIAFALIKLFQVQIQDPASMSTTTRALSFLAKFAEIYKQKMFDTRIQLQLKAFERMNVAPVAPL